ncbi:MAG: tRNA uridine-5-carboxymethylaminomethyl(34) synthesis enzyme MnmG [Phycisphaerae bacterium]
MGIELDFDLIVVGGGHAGAEAAWAGAKLLSGTGRVAMITMDPAAIGRMSCNPAIGGLAKGQMVREIDALGGLMAHAIDATGIQFRMLNESKGAAVRSPRAQADKYRYARAVQQLLKTGCPNLTIIAGSVEDVEVEPETCESGRVQVVRGVTLGDGSRLACRCVVLTTGTFLRGLMHTGEEKTVGGRVGEQAAVGLSGALRRLGFELGRLKTGTPPRIARESIDFGRLSPQWGDDPPRAFSYLSGTADSPLAGRFPVLPQVPCYITFTNPAVHDVIRSNLHRAPMYSGQIQSRGPRYCPSIEDKVVRFADKTQHQIFLEPESLDTNEIYCNGISTSLPADVQREIVRQIEGLEKAEILRFGYAVEYDFSPTHQIDASLETRTVQGLYFAGQLNGTSGYEEAAGQGLMAGINAARRCQNLPPVILRRDEAYIGVMIDDLVTKTPTEPYRMFTSRAEFRLRLRSDNADQRLTPIAEQIGLADRVRVNRLAALAGQMQVIRESLAAAHLNTGQRAIDMLRRPDVPWRTLADWPWSDSRLAELTRDPSLADAWEQVQTQLRYEGYIQRDQQAAERLRELEGRRIPAQMDFASLRELRKEAREALQKFRPLTLAQASRLEGMTPADMLVLSAAMLGRRN